MELLYVWIEDYKNIKKQGFNFSPKHWFDFEYEEDENKKVTGGTLKHEERNPNYPNNFFGENTRNVTAIVGKNGSGKTNLTDVISEFIAGKWESKYTFSVWTDKIDGNTIYYSSRNINSDVNLIPILNIHLKLNHFNYTGILQYLPLGNRTHDLSTFERLAKTNIRYEIRENDNGVNNFKPFLTVFNEYQFKEVTDQITFFNKASQVIEATLGSKIYIPNKLEVKLYRYGGNFYPKEKDADVVTSNLREQIIYGFYISILENLCEHNSIEKSKIAYQEIIDSYDETIGAIESLIRFIKNHPLASHSYNTDLFYQSKNALVRIIQFFESDKYNFFSSLIEDFIKEEKYRDKFKIKIKDNNSDVIEFITEIRSCLGKLQHLISYQWEGLSYGENQVLKLGSSIYNTLQLPPDQVKSILITIDEGELGLHAEWQRKYLPLVLNTLKSLLPTYNFQLVFTSHSPFLVSDLPKDNIIFLNKDKFGLCKVEPPEDITSTFGANIHSLYRNSFFLENGLMGEFAKGKIDQVIRNLNNETINEDDKISPEVIQFVIQQIGEPLIKDKLQRMYDDHPDFGLDENIEKLQLKLDELKFKKNGSNTNS